MKQNLFSTLCFAVVLCCVCRGQASMRSQRVGTFAQEVRVNYTEADGLLDNEVQALAVCASGEVYAATRAGLGFYAQGKWQTVPSLKGQAVWMLACQGNTVVALTGRSGGEYLQACQIHIVKSQRVERLFPVPDQFRVRAGVKGMALDTELFLVASNDVYALNLKETDDAVFARARALNLQNPDIRQIAVHQEGGLYVAARSGLLGYDAQAQCWTPVYPQ
ncbi:MAG: hypothetical protein HQ515_14250, partial [Phycisphaeraceae bacterium]|nr:hypothetical protein [Phycisphaeraceae bacterium]